MLNSKKQKSIYIYVYINVYREIWPKAFNSFGQKQSIFGEDHNQPADRPLNKWNNSLFAVCCFWFPSTLGRAVVDWNVLVRKESWS